MKISVFDLDHTLLKVNSSSEFGIYLFRQKIISLSTLSMCLMNYFFHKFCNLSIKKLHKNIFAILFNGKSSSEINCQVTRFLNLKFTSFIRHSALQRLQIARQRGDYLVILSSSPNFLVEPIARLFGVNEWVATQYCENESKDLSYISSFCQGEDKADFVKLLSARFDIPLTAFTMYSDSYLDLPAMLIVGQAVGVSPDRKLKKICFQKGWEIL